MGWSNRLSNIVGNVKVVSRVANTAIKGSGRFLNGLENQLNRVYSLRKSTDSANIDSEMPGSLEDISMVDTSHPSSSSLDETVDTAYSKRGANYKGLVKSVHAAWLGGNSKSFMAKTLDISLYRMNIIMADALRSKEEGGFELRNKNIIESDVSTLVEMYLKRPRGKSLKYRSIPKLLEAYRLKTGLQITEKTMYAILGPDVRRNKPKSAPDTIADLSTNYNEPQSITDEQVVSLEDIHLELKRELYKKRGDFETATEVMLQYSGKNTGEGPQDKLRIVADYFDEISRITDTRQPLEFLITSADLNNKDSSPERQLQAVNQYERFIARGGNFSLLTDEVILELFGRISIQQLDSYVSPDDTVGKTNQALRVRALEISDSKSYDGNNERTLVNLAAAKARESTIISKSDPALGEIYKNKAKKYAASAVYAHEGNSLEFVKNILSNTPNHIPQAFGHGLIIGAIKNNLENIGMLENIAQFYSGINDISDYGKNQMLADTFEGAYQQNPENLELLRLAGIYHMATSPIFGFGSPSSPKEIGIRQLEVYLALGGNSDIPISNRDLLKTPEERAEMIRKNNMRYYGNEEGIPPTWNHEVHGGDGFWLPNSAFITSQKKAEYRSILGIESETYTNQELTKAFREKALDYHPDRKLSLLADEGKFKEINEAYMALGKQFEQKANIPTIVTTSR